MDITDDNKGDLDLERPDSKRGLFSRKTDNAEIGLDEKTKKRRKPRGKKRSDAIVFLVIFLATAALLAVLYPHFKPQISRGVGQVQNRVKGKQSVPLAKQLNGAMANGQNSNLPKPAPTEEQACGDSFTQSDISIITPAKNYLLPDIDHDRSCIKIFATPGKNGKTLAFQDRDVFVVIIARSPEEGGNTEGAVIFPDKAAIVLSNYGKVWPMIDSYLSEMHKEFAGATPLPVTKGKNPQNLTKFFGDTLSKL